ncbi:hypothetical protein HWN40_05680 [Methanolobus zinderi]|uniref:Uncharacterized protein n=1 Tax=Methanolobus zinderi TaxID=536044 RepID=A0A7D5E7W7_9EURY|nr:hypothetical protein [Methanolobus zinderi]QLC49771.1 hypothetical protein HWN40_05680 [Methanolobus zinderi]
MHRILQNMLSIYHNYRLIPLFLSVSVIIDYSLTFYFAGSIENILAHEFSPTLVFAVKNDIVLPYLAVIVVFYYFMGYTILKFLDGEEIYPIGVFIIMLMSLTHVLGGMSWYVLSESYSNMIFMLSMTSVIIALSVFGYEIFRKG